MKSTELVTRILDVKSPKLNTPYTKEVLEDYFKTLVTLKVEYICVLEMNSLGERLLHKYKSPRQGLEESFIAHSRGCSKTTKFELIKKDGFIFNKVITNEYEAYGDVNPIEHGGQWVKKVGETEYEIVTLHLLDDDNEDSLVLGQVIIDVNDAWIDKKSVQDYADISDSDERFALDAISYYGIEDCGGTLDSIDLDEVVDILMSLGIVI